MSTYTQYHLRTKENISRLRNPGNANDGECPDRVIFTNTENIYYGTFAGKMNIESAYLDNVTINGSTINGSKLKDVMICNEDGVSVSIDDLTSNVSEISGNLNDFLGNTLPEMQDAIAQTATSEGMKQLSIALTSTIDSVSSFLLSNDNAISDEISSSILPAIEGLQNEGASASLSIGDLIRSVDALQDVCAGLPPISDGLYDLSVAFEEHERSNISTFSELCAKALSSLEHDKHYEMYGLNAELLSSYPYNVKDFAINIIKDKSQDFALKNHGNIYGNGYYYGESKTSAHVVLNGLNGLGIVTDNVQKDLEKDGPSYAIANDNTTIRWDSIQGVVVNRSGKRFINLFYQYNNKQQTVGTIRDFELDDRGYLLSGVLQMIWSDVEPYFPNRFISEATGIGQYMRFSQDDRLSSSQDGSLAIQFNPGNSQSFTFFDGVSSIYLCQLSGEEPSEHAGFVFGKIISNDISYDDDEKASSIKVSGITLPVSSERPFINSATLDARNNFTSYLSSDIFISCGISSYVEDDDETGESISSQMLQFDVISSVAYYKYSLQDANDSNDAMRGYVMPGTSNVHLSSRGFSVLSLHLNFPSELGELTSIWNQDYVLYRDGNAWQCISADDMSNSISIAFEFDGWTSAHVNLSGYSASVGGVAYTASYSVMNDEQVDSQTSACVDIIKSAAIKTPISYSTVELTGSTAYETYNGYPQTSPELNEIFTFNDYAGGGSTALQVNVPPRVEGDPQCSREFIIATKIESAFDSMDLSIANAYASSIEDKYLPVYSNGHAGATIPTNKWVTLQVKEVDVDKFIVHDLDNSQLTSDIQHLVEDVGVLSDGIDFLSSNVDDLWKNIRGGLNFMGVLSVDRDEDVLSSFLAKSFVNIYQISPAEAAGMPVRQGFFYPINAEDHLSHYNIAGLEVEHGDWLIAKENFIVSNATSSCMTVFDAQDYDVVRKNDDNTFTGTNVFEGKTFLNDVSAASLSVELSDATYDNEGHTLQYAFDQKAQYLGTFASIADPTLTALFVNLPYIDAGTMLHKGVFVRSGQKIESLPDAAGDVRFIGINDYLIVGNDVILSNMTWQDIDIICDPTVESQKISADLSALRLRVDGAELSIDGLSNELSDLSFQCMHYRGDLSAGDDDTLYRWIEHTYGIIANIYGYRPPVKAGAMHRVNDLSIEMLDYYGETIKLFKNDYIIFKNDLPDITKAALSDINIIRDAEVEGIILSTVMEANDAVLSNAIDEKIFIDELSTASLCAIHISQDDFYQKVVDGKVLSNEMHVVSSSYINAYGEQMKNLAEPTDLSDAATKNYSDIISVELRESLDDLTKKLYDELSVVEDYTLSTLNYKSKISAVISAVIEVRDAMNSMRDTLRTLIG